MGLLAKEGGLFHQSEHAEISTVTNLKINLKGSEVAGTSKKV